MDRDEGLLESAAAGVRGVRSDPRASGALDCREMDQGEVREETVMGKACGGKLGSHGSKAILLSQA